MSETPIPIEQSTRTGQTTRWRLNNEHHACFRSAHVEWGTPPDLYAALDKEFCFTLDPCKKDGVWDGLSISWIGERVFCNPPYGRKAHISQWLSKAREAELAVFLLPARTDTIWFHEHALKADEIRFFKGRLHFASHIRPKEKWLEGAPFPSMLVIYGSSVPNGMKTSNCLLYKALKLHQYYDTVRRHSNPRRAFWMALLIVALLSFAVVNFIIYH